METWKDLSPQFRKAYDGACWDTFSFRLDPRSNMARREELNGGCVAAEVHWPNLYFHYTMYTIQSALVGCTSQFEQERLTLTLT